MNPRTDVARSASQLTERKLSGGIRVIPIRAGWFRPDAGSFFGPVPRAIWSRVADVDPQGRLLCALNLLLVEAPGARMLIETGIGAHMSERDRVIWGAEGGDAVEALKAVEINPESIDFVIVSHLHRDHAGGMTDAAGRPSFPSARYVIQRDEIEAAHGQELRVRGALEKSQLDALLAAGCVMEVVGDAEIAPGVRVVRTGGHTRGSQAVILGTEGERGDRAIFFGDLVPTTTRLATRWTSAHDDYPVEAVETRHRYLSQAAADGWWCYFTHEPGDMPVRIQATDRGFSVLDA